jgi:hypothetical protein
MTPTPRPANANTVLTVCPCIAEAAPVNCAGETPVCEAFHPEVEAEAIEAVPLLAVAATAGVADQLPSLPLLAAAAAEE